MVSCPICQKEMSYINNSHLSIHNLTPKEFKNLYPDLNHIDEKARELMIRGQKKGIERKKELQEKTLSLKNKKFIEKNKVCLNCNTPILFEKRRNKFCNHSCAASFCNKDRKVIYSKEGLESLKKTGKKNIVHLINCDRVPAKIYRIKCMICDKLFERDSSGKSHKTCSKKCTLKWHSKYNFRQNKTYGKCGYYQGIFCASSWELAFLVYNKDLGKDIKRCDVTFDYYIENEFHTYFPDFLMDNMIYEVKGYEKEDVKIKTQAVINAGYQIKIIRKKEIEPIIKEIKQKYQVKDITELYDK